MIRELQSHALPLGYGALFIMERVKRIELSQSAWKAEVLPLNYTRIGFRPSNVLLSHLRTTLGAKELNFCVRYGNRCALLAIITRPFGDLINLPKLDIFFSCLVKSSID